MELTDRLRPTAERDGLERRISLIDKSGRKALVRLAAGKTIVDLGKGLYAVDDSRYYVQVPDFQTKKYTVLSGGGRQELVLESAAPQTEVLYYILF
jgi:hypothetical protein